MNWLFMNKPKRPNRVSVDVDDLSEDIQAYKPDSFWKKSSLAQKVRHLVEVALGIADEKRILKDFVRDLSYGNSLDRYSCLVIARVLELEPDVIERLKKNAATESTGQPEAKPKRSGSRSGRGKSDESE